MLKPIASILTIALVFSACGNTESASVATEPEKREAPVEKESAQEEKENKTENALKFINGYIDNANKMNEAVGMVEWVNANEFVTKTFKKELKRIVDEAYAEDPEMGLDADPIVDAQDYPEKGFELESMDDETNCIIVKGKDWPDFKLTLKVVEVNGEWLVDGCGIVNVPANQRATR